MHTDMCVKREILTKEKANFWDFAAKIVDALGIFEELHKLHHLRLGLCHAGHIRKPAILSKRPSTLDTVYLTSCALRWCRQA